MQSDYSKDQIKTRLEEAVREAHRQTALDLKDRSASYELTTGYISKHLQPALRKLKIKGVIKHWSFNTKHIRSRMCIDTRVKGGMYGYPPESVTLPYFLPDTVKEHHTKRFFQKIANFLLGRRDLHI